MLWIGRPTGRSAAAIEHLIADARFFGGERQVLLGFGIDVSREVGQTVGWKRQPPDDGGAGRHGNRNADPAKLQVVEETMNGRADVCVVDVGGVVGGIAGRLAGGDEGPALARAAKRDDADEGRPDVKADGRSVPCKKTHAKRVLRQGPCHEREHAAKEDGRNYVERAGMFDNSAIETYHLRLPLFESGRKGEHGEG